jgi:hypothetical protein
MHASHAGRSELTGVVLTEAVSVVGKTHEIVFDADPQAVWVPALVVANHDDRCGSHRRRGRTKSPINTQRTRAGADPARGIAKSSNECSSLTPHGYWGSTTRSSTP